MLDAISWIIGYWSFLAWLTGISVACLVLRFYLGDKIAWTVGVIGLLVGIFLLGRKTERNRHRQRVRDIREKREKAYEEIDQRNTDRDDVLERLRSNGF